MFSTHWYFALGVLFITAAISVYVGWKGNKIEWGDGVRGLRLTLAQYFLLKLEDKDFHPKNWRPQLLVLIKSTMERSKQLKMLELAEQLKAGRGLTLVSTIIRGDALNAENRAKAKDMKRELQEEMKKFRIKGFVRSFIFNEENISGNVDAIIQSAGIGGLKPNTIMVSSSPHSYGDVLQPCTSTIYSPNACKALYSMSVVK